jgi:hypothetical protein
LAADLVGAAARNGDAMTWHLFVLVWGDIFVERFARLVVPFLAMPGNVPALAADDKVVLHVYSDAGSRSGLEAALAPLASYCAIDIRVFDDHAARRFRGAQYRYELQRESLRDLVRSLSDGSLILLDSNFLPSDGTLANLAVQRAKGYRAACVTFVRTETAALDAALRPYLAKRLPIDGRTLFTAASSSLHHITESFFVDATPFTPYPSQIAWRVGASGFVSRNFLPHPLMIPVSDALHRSQSTMDYDLALRTASDEEIYIARDSDDMLLVKFSGEDHHAERDGAPAPTPDQIGLFLLTCTNRRHRLFADVPALFHAGGRDAGYEAAIAESHRLIDDAYGWIDQIAAQAGRLDARMLMYLKSHLGPIEDFMSPQLEPTALGRLP